MGNVLINSIGPNLRQVEVQLIDWNLASFYYPGYESSTRKGTECYYAPELLLRRDYITPAMDIWSLAVVYFTFLTSRKPFPSDCSKNNL